MPARNYNSHDLPQEATCLFFSQFQAESNLWWGSSLSKAMEGAHKKIDKEEKQDDAPVVGSLINPRGRWKN